MKLHSLGTKEVSCEGEQDIVSAYNIISKSIRSCIYQKMDL
jgi:hypothetical protein